MNLRFPRLKNLREDRDLKQRDIAKYLNCTQVSYSYYELGKREIPVEILIKLSKFYNCSVDYLLGLTDMPEPYPANRLINPAKKSNVKNNIEIKA